MAELNGAVIKWQRAQRHLQSLQDSINAWREAQDPEPFRGPDNDEDGKWVFRWAFKEDPPLGDWSATLGDLVHNLRSALDHLTWQLVLREGNEPWRRNEFPIFDDPEVFEKKSVPKLRGINDPDVLALIESAQPYHPVENWQGTHPLWFIHELDRIDKHQTLHLLAHSLSDDTVITATSRYPDGRVVDTPVTLVHSAAKDGAVFAWVEHRPGTEVTVDLEFRLETALVPRGDLDLGAKIRAGNALGSLVKFTGHVLATFEDAFFQPAHFFRKVPDA